MELLNPRYDYVKSISFKFGLDKEGNFNGNMSYFKEGTWRNTTISEFNRQHLSKPASTDCETGDCGR